MSSSSSNLSTFFICIFDFKRKKKYPSYLYHHLQILRKKNERKKNIDTTKHKSLAPQIEFKGWRSKKGVYFLTITFPTMLPSRAPCKISKNTPGPDYIIWNRLLVLSRKWISDQMLCAFFVFLWCKGSLLTVIWTSHKLQCNCMVHMNGQQWPWHHRHP